VHSVRNKNKSSLGKNKNQPMAVQWAGPKQHFAEKAPETIFFRRTHRQSAQHVRCTLGIANPVLSGNVLVLEVDASRPRLNRLENERRLENDHSESYLYSFQHSMVATVWGFSRLQMSSNSLEGCCSAWHVCDTGSKPS
jgi:hypothetical protein